MNLYILEMIIVVILAIIVSIILKVKNVKKVGAVIGTLILILLIVFGITFLLEKPDVNITGTQMNVEVKQANSLKAPKIVYHFKDKKSQYQNYLMPFRGADGKEYTYVAPYGCYKEAMLYGEPTDVELIPLQCR